jgi:AraC-type DNA-binding domain-containing proteins
VSDKSIIEKVLVYIDDHIEEELSLDKIATVFNYSKFYMERTFAEKTGCTIYKYIQRKRLTQAAQKLVESNKPIVEIAYEAHYSSQQAFTQAFGRVYQCSPQMYRKNGIFYPVQMQIALCTTQVLFVKNYKIGGRMVA